MTDWTMVAIIGKILSGLFEKKFTTNNFVIFTIPALTSLNLNKS